MTLKPLDQHDPRLRQVCAPFESGAVADAGAAAARIDALLDFVWSIGNKHTAAQERDHSRPSTVWVVGQPDGIMKQLCVVDLAIGGVGMLTYMCW